MCFLKRDYVRWGQPIQQQGRRMPPFILETALAMRIPRVSAFLPDVTQHTHSLRASGEMSSQSCCTFGIAASACFRSCGVLCGIFSTTSFGIKALLHKIVSERRVLQVYQTHSNQPLTRRLAQLQFVEFRNREPLCFVPVIFCFQRDRCSVLV